MIISFYQKELLPNLKARSSKSYVLSDILILYAHRLVSLVHAVVDYVDRLDSKSKKEIVHLSSSNPAVQKSQTLPCIPDCLSPVSRLPLNSLTDIPHEPSA